MPYTNSSATGSAGAAGSAGSTATEDGTTKLLDSTFPTSIMILVERFTKYLQLISAIERMADYYIKVAASDAKLNQQLSTNVLTKDLPSWEMSPNPAGLEADTNRAAKQTTEVDLNVFVYNLKGNIDREYKAAVELQTQIQKTILPPLKSLSSSIESRQKTFVSAANKLLKEIHNLRNQSISGVNKLGLSIEAFNSKTDGSRVDYHNDPYLTHRAVEYESIVQIQKENQFIDFLQNNENFLQVLEAQTMIILQGIYKSLTLLVTEYYNDKSKSTNDINNVFQAIPPQKEWSNFAASHEMSLVSSQSLDGPDTKLAVQLANVSLATLATPADTTHKNKLKRSYDDVTFVGKSDPSTQALLEGKLAKKGGFTKKYSDQYYVITQERHFLEFPTSAIDTAAPTLALYLPNCSIQSELSEGKYKFIIRGKDTTRMLSRKKNLAFKANTEVEFQTWYNVISEVSGQMAQKAEDDLTDSEPETEAAEASTAAAATTTTTATTTAAPTTTETDASSVTRTVAGPPVEEQTAETAATAATAETTAANDAPANEWADSRAI